MNETPNDYEDFDVGWKTTASHVFSASDMSPGAFKGMIPNPFTMKVDYMDCEGQERDYRRAGCYVDGVVPYNAATVRFKDQVTGETKTEAHRFANQPFHVKVDQPSTC